MGQYFSLLEQKIYVQPLTVLSVNWKNAYGDVEKDTITLSDLDNINELIKHGYYDFKFYYKYYM